MTTDVSHESEKPKDFNIYTDEATGELMVKLHDQNIKESLIKAMHFSGCNDEILATLQSMGDTIKFDTVTSMVQIIHDRFGPFPDFIKPKNGVTDKNLPLLALNLATVKLHEIVIARNDLKVNAENTDHLEEPPFEVHNDGTITLSPQVAESIGIHLGSVRLTVDVIRSLIADSVNKIKMHPLMPVVSALRQFAEESQKAKDNDNPTFIPKLGSEASELITSIATTQLRIGDTETIPQFSLSTDGTHLVFKDPSVIRILGKSISIVNIKDAIERLADAIAAETSDIYHIYQVLTVVLAHSGEAWVDHPRTGRLSSLVSNIGNRILTMVRKT